MKFRVALGAVLVGVVASLLANPTADAAAKAAAAPSCTTKPVKANGSPWQCTFADEFSGSSLDSSKWVPQTTAFSGFSVVGTCFVNSPNNIFVSGGALNLVARTETKSQSCNRAGLAPFATNRTGGAVVSYDKFQQAYGRFEFRAKYANTREAGFYGNMWILPRNSVYGAWPNSGEVDIAEAWSGHGDRVFPTLHYLGSTTADSGWNCTVKDVRQFHLYRLEWTSAAMKFYYDDKLCYQRSWTPSWPLSAPKPFDQTFFLTLSQGFGDPYYPISAKLPSKGALVVDWVRVWK